jgi:hypothetical protein
MSDATSIKPSLSKNIEETREKLTVTQEGLAAPTKGAAKAPMDEKAISILTGSTLKTLRITTPANTQPEERKPVSMPEIRASKMPEMEMQASADTETESVLALAPSNMMATRRPAARITTIMGVLLTAVWFGLCAGYVHTYIGWDQLMSLQPHLLGGFMAGVMAPVALLWMAMTYIQRGSDVHMYAGALRAELQAMIFPSEERSQVIHKDIEALCHQAAELSAASKAVLKSIHRARLGLRSEINDLTGMSKKAEFHIDRLSETLHERSAKLLTLTDEIDRRSGEIDKRTKLKLQEWDDQAQSLLTRAQEMELSLGKGAQRLEGAAEKVARTADTVASITDAAKTIARSQHDLEQGVQGLADKVSGVTTLLGGSLEGVEKSVTALMDRAGGLEGRLGEKTQSLQGAVDTLDKRIASIETIGQEAASRMSDAMSVALSGAEALGSAARRAVEQMNRAATESRLQSEDMLKDISAQIDKMQAEGKGSGESLKSLLALMEDSRRQLEQSMAMTDRHVERLSQAVEDQLSRIHQAESGLAAKSSTIADTLLAPIQTIERAVERAESCHTMMGETLGQRVSDLNAVSEKAVANVTTIRDTMREQARDLTTLSGQVAGYSRSLTENLSRHRADIEGTVKSSLVQMETVRSVIEDQAVRLKAVAGDTESRMSVLKDSMTGYCSSIASSTQDVLGGLSALDGKLEGRVTSLREGATAASQAISTVTEALNATAEGFEPIYQRAIDRAQGATARLEKLRSGFDESAESNLAKLKSIGIVFDEKLETLKAGADQAARLLKTSGDYLQTRTEGIQMAAQEVSRRITDIGQTLEHQSSDIHLASDQAVMRIEVVRKAVDAQFQDITAGVDQSLVLFKNTGDEFTRQMAQAKAVAESALAGFDRAGMKAREETAQMREQASQMVGTTLKLVEDVNREAEKLLSSSNATMTDLKRTGESFALRAREVAEHMKSALRTSESYTADLGKQADLVAQSSVDAADKISGAVSALSSRMDRVGAIADDVTARVGASGEKLFEESQRLVTISAKALQAAEDTSATFVRQSGALFKAAQLAAEQAEKIRSEEGRAQRQAFMASARFVVESLHSMSIDITRAMDGEVPEKSWKAYQKGDLAAFTRRLAEMGDKLPIDRMRKKFAEDTEFRTYVGRFIRQFEDVYEQALATDHGELMAMTFGSSDVGRLYQTLCLAAGKEAKGLKSATSPWAA